MSNGLVNAYPENVVCLLHLLHILKWTSDYVSMKSINVKPDQAAPKGPV